jgi:hydroxyethylthiazole kinase-like uncharacterized protein yjeF
MISSDEMRLREGQAMASGVSEPELIEAAGHGLAREILSLRATGAHLRLYLGSGHNAADALAASRHLQAAGMTWEAHWAQPVELARPETRRQWELLLATGIRHGQRTRRGPQINVDGLVGLGANRCLEGRFAQLVGEMNQSRTSGAFTVAVDLPSGLLEAGVAEGSAVVCADATICLGEVKSWLLDDAAGPRVGRLSVVALPGMPAPSAQLLGHHSLRGLLPTRPWNGHKGSVGRVGIVAGSPGMVGAAELACAGALRAGAGLVTLWCDPRSLDILSARLPAEVMVRPFLGTLPHERLEALALGPGLGVDHQCDVLRLVRSDPRPMVVDADALRASGLDWRRLLAASAGARILTPHAGEMQRLRWPALAQCDTRASLAASWAEQCSPHVLVLKGARSIVAQAGQKLCMNGTGHPGMATGGMGDMLTGVTVGLLAQGMSPRDAARVAVWACGRSAELAAQRLGWRSVLPSDAVADLGAALEELSWD